MMGRGRRRRVAVLSLTLFALLALPATAIASPTECDWEWGGVAEATPEPCSTPVPVAVQGSVPVTQDVSPWGVQIEGSTTTLSADGNVTLNDDGRLATALVTALGLLVFLQSVSLVHGFARRR